MKLLHRKDKALQQLKELRQDPQLRYKHQSLVITGHKLLQEAQKAHSSIIQIYRTNQCPAISPTDLLVSAHDLGWACGLENFPKDGCAAILQMPKANEPKKESRQLILDGLQDPGNVGTLIRTAAAFGMDGVICLSPMCDPYNEKAIRASMGACLHLPICTLDTALIQALIADLRPNLYVADISLEAMSVHAGTKLGPYSWIAIGSEARGARGELKKDSKRLYLKMSDKVESLNAATAGSILLFLSSSS